MTNLFVIVCDSGQYEDTRTTVVCIAGTKSAAERTCKDANAILRDGADAVDEVEVAYFDDPEEAYKKRREDALRPFRKRLAEVVGDFDAEFSGDETMRAVRAAYRPRRKGEVSHG